MASAAALMAGNRRRVVSEVSQQLGRQAKAAVDLGVTGQVARRPNSGPSGNQPVVRPPTRTVGGGIRPTNGNGTGPLVDTGSGIIVNFNPDLGGSGGFPLPGGGGSGGGIYGGACDMLPEYLRDACRYAAGFLPGGGGTTGGGTGMTTCPSGTIKVGNQCIALGDAFPGGDPFTTGAGGQAVQGAFGLPAYTPVQEQRTVRRCGPGLVLGKDNLCYPKAVLPRRSSYRKHKGAQRPPITAADAKAIRKAAAAKDRVKELAGKVGFSCKKR